MSSLIYAPEVTVRILTAVASAGKGKVIDVSEDMISGSVTRILGPGISTAQFRLLNQSRKYDGVFSPMDSVVVYLRRINKAVLKFSGYLDSVPLWSSEPNSVNLQASCTMKRLANFLWDPHAPASSTLMQRGLADPTNDKAEDNGLAARTIGVMTKVAGWKQDQIHIANIPSSWYDQVSSLADKIVADAETAQMASTLGVGSYVNGTNPAGAASSTTKGLGPGTGTGTMPASSGKCSEFGGPNGGAYGHFALTGESGTHPVDQWYCAMRWPYVTDHIGTIPGLDVGKSVAWWANRRILVTNPATNKAVVVRAADWGPNISTGRVIDLAPGAMAALGAHTDSVLNMGFAPPGASLGRASAGATATSSLGANLAVTGGAPGSGVSSSPGGITSGWTPVGSNQVSARGAGCSFTCNRQAKAKFEGFLDDLVSQLGYHPAVVMGYANRGIAGSSQISNHAYGAAIDIDPTINPRYPTGAGGRYALPKPPAIIRLARKWGLKWGGEYRHSKDYMHFEVIGAPATGPVPGVSASTGSAPVVVAKWTPPIHNPPGYVITNRFGASGPYAHLHTGVDFAGIPIGTDIYSVGAGTVHLKGYDGSYGNWVSVDMGGGYFTMYGHMREQSSLAIGTQVTASTVIGHVGMTGNTTGPHVHTELRKGSDSYSGAIDSIEKYVTGGANRPDPPAGTVANAGDYSAGGAAASPGTGTAAPAMQMGQGLFNVFQFYENLGPTLGGTLLTDYRAIMNDEPVLNTIEQFMQAGMRDFCTAPNGDFIAWFPDYFGHFNQIGKMVVSPLEISIDSGPPTIGWSDVNLRTHQFVYGNTSTMGANVDDVYRMATTAGVASVEMPELMSALFDISIKEATTMGQDMLFRYGARPEVTPLTNISGPREEFFFACYLFQKNWAQQYQTTVNLTFMPELYPGMMLCLPVYGIQGYIVETTDSWDLASGGFTTEVACAPWSTIGGSKKTVIAGLPRGAPL